MIGSQSGSESDSEAGRFTQFWSTCGVKLALAVVSSRMHTCIKLRGIGFNTDGSIVKGFRALIAFVSYTAVSSI